MICCLIVKYSACTCEESDSDVDGVVEVRLVGRRRRKVRVRGEMWRAEERNGSVI